MEEEKGLLKDVKIPVRELLKRTLKYIKPYRKKFVIGFLLIILNVALDIIFPKLMGYYTDILSDLNPSNATYQVLNSLIWISVGVFLIFVVNQFFLYIETMILTKAGQQIIYDLRMEVFHHIESMSQNQFNEMPVGSLVTRVCNYTSSLSEFFTNTLVKILKNLLTVIGVFAFMLTIEWRLSLVLLGVVALVFGISYYFSYYVHKKFKLERNLLSDLNTYLNEALSGMSIIQIFNQQKKSDRKFVVKNDAYRKTRYGVICAFGVYRPLISLIYLGTVAMVLYLGVYWALTPGAIVAFYLYLSRFFNPIQELADELNHVTKAITAVERLFNLIDIKPEVMDLPTAKPINLFEGKIEFKHVWFAYEGEDWILKDVSFVVNPRETAAFVGATGAGKTTILGLIVRNFEIQKGQILIDDVDIKDISIDSLRRGIGQMLQDVFLFSGTVRENITLFDEHFTDDEINSAIDYVNATEMIDSLPDKLEAKVIEKGENFSVGQRQLLSFARTTLHKPQILILDEATAHIDTETELKIQESLLKMKNIGTMLVVAHRLSTIQHSDKIIVLSHGEIVEIGSHQELLKKKGLYHKLFQLQFEKR